MKCVDKQHRLSEYIVDFDATRRWNQQADNTVPPFLSTVQNIIAPKLWKLRLSFYLLTLEAP